MQIFLELIFNLGVLISISLMTGFIPHQEKKWQESIYQGTLLGLAAVIGMLHPLVITPGLIFDGRSIMISLAGAFFGPVAAGIAAAIAGALRLYQGGMGTFMGVSTILVSALLGSWYYAWRRRRRIWQVSYLQLYLLGLAVHASLVLLMFTLPQGAGLKVFAIVGLPLLAIFPLATILIGGIIKFSLERRNMLKTLEDNYRELNEGKQHTEAVLQELTATEEELRAQQQVLEAQYALLRQQKEELEKSNAKNVALLAAIPDLVFILNTQGVITDFHASDPATLLLPPGSFLGKGFAEVLPPDVAVGVKQMIEELFRTGEIQRFNYQLEINGKVADYELRAIKAGAEEIYAIVRDTSEDKALENALAASEKRFRSYVENSPTGIFIANGLGDYCDVNPAACQITGYSREELLGMNLLDLIPESAQALAQASFAKVRGDGQAEVDVPFLRRDGSLGYWRVQAVALDDGTYIGFVVDLTQMHAYQEELKQAKDAALAANVAKSRFLANMSHEIRTPLNGLMGLGQLLAETQLDQGQRDYLYLMKQTADVLLKVVGDILDYAKIEAGKLELENKPFRLAEILNDALGMFQYSARQKNLELALHLEQGMPEEYSGDAFRLRQVLANLLGNAVKYTESGEISVTVTRNPIQDDLIEVQFAVRDTGVGIPQEQAEHIFDDFVQGDSSSTRRYGGTGLGLAISRGLVEKMGGRIWVETSPGQGSCFYFTCSLRPESQSSKDLLASAESHPDKNITAASGIILIAEDEPISRMVAVKLVNSFGWEALAAKDGQEAVALWQQGDIAAILMDVQMPVMDGYQATAVIRQLEAAEGMAPVPIIALTAHALTDDREKCLAEGMSDYLTKPVDAQKLKTTLLKWTAK